MRPADIIEFTRQFYSKQQTVTWWNEKKIINSGLNSVEMSLIKQIPHKRGRLLLLGLGGGREAISFAEMGFQVTGIDFVTEMIEQAKKNFSMRNLQIDLLIQDISRLNVDEGVFDLVWLSAFMYSYVPTKKNRVDMLLRIYRALKPEGYFICQFWWKGNTKSPKWYEICKRALAWLTFGNTSYETGDMLHNNHEFIHGFISANDLRAEFSKGGFEIKHLIIPESGPMGSAILKKSI